MNSCEDLRTTVVVAGGLQKTTMGTLKKIDGAGRLGVHVRNSISRTLQSHGLAHLPRELPPNQDDDVRLYLLGTPIADLIEAVLTPSDRGDETLRSVGGSEAQEQLRRIREIVCG